VSYSPPRRGRRCWPATPPGHAATPAPILIAQGTDDQVVTSAATRALVQRLCRLGDAVKLRTWPHAGHFDLPEAASTAAVAWIGDRLAGRSARSTCQS
jgi:predicted esterase